MTNTHEIEQSGNFFLQALDSAVRLPGVRIDRSAYLRKQLSRHCSEETIELAIQTSPAEAGVSRKVVEHIANTAISYETSKVSGISFLAGLPGGLAMWGTVPADLAQFLGHMLRVAQKLAYIYSWPDLFSSEEDAMDDETESMLVLFIGVMFGVQIAQGGLQKVAIMVAANTVTELPKKALTKGLIYPIVKKVASKVGADMTKKIFASGVAKAIPVVGAVTSSGLTLATFRPMSKRLQKHLASLENTKPGLRPDTGGVSESEVIFEAEVVDDSETASSEPPEVEKNWKSKLPKISRPKRKDDDAS